MTQRRSPPPRPRACSARSLALRRSFSRSPAVPIRPRCSSSRRVGAARCETGPKLLAITIDHRLRPESAAEARAVSALARRLGVPHRTVRWEGRKPKTGLQEAARQARYRLLAESAVRMKAQHILTAHTLDDQAETMLMRLTRGSGVSGLCGMTPLAPVPAGQHAGIVLVRPLLDIPKARLVATLQRAGIAFADDPSNRDPRFTRARLRRAHAHARARGARCAAPGAAGETTAARGSSPRSGG